MFVPVPFFATPLARPTANPTWCGVMTGPYAPGGARSMGRKRYRSEDDLADAAYEVSRALGSGWKDARAVDRAEWERRREARRERYRERAQRNLIAVGVGLLAGGLAASLGLITPAAVGVGLLAGGFSGLILRWIGDAVQRWRSAPAAPRPATIDTPKVDVQGMTDARADLVRKVIDEATADLRRLDAAAANLVDGEARLLAQRLVRAGERLAQAVAAAPDKFAVAQRAFTYHLPKAVYLAETLGALDAAGADEKRRTAARHVLARMENLFEKTALDLANVDAREMDVELRLINQALDEDLDRGPTAKG